MENKIEEIMKEYEDGIKSIDNKYEVKAVREPKTLDTKELDGKIEYEKSFIAKLKNEGEDVNKDMIEKAEARLQLAENEKKEIEKNYEEKLARYNKSIDKREEKVLEKEKMKRSLVVLPSGREVTMAEKDKMDKQELKDIAIRKLTQESKNISEELLKKDKEVENINKKIETTNKEIEAINKEMINVDYEIRISTERDDDKIEKRDELNQKLLDLRKKMENLSDIKEECIAYSEKLSTIQEKCSAYLEELKAPTKEDKAFSEAWNEAYKKEQQDERNGQGTQRSGQGKQQGEDKTEPIYKIEIGKNAKITMAGGHEFKVNSKDVKKGLNLSEEQTLELLDEYIDNDNSVLLAQQLIKENKFDKTVLNVIAKSDMDYNTKKKLVNSYYDKCLLPKEVKEIDIKYNAEEMSKVNIFKRLFKRELNNNEKSELLAKAKKAEKLGIAQVEGEYKINTIEKVIGKLGGTLRLPEPSDAQVEAAYKYNENRDKEDFKGSIKNFKSEMSKEGYKEMKGLARAEKKQNEISDSERDDEEDIDL